MLNCFFTASDRVTESGWRIKNLIHSSKMVGQIWIERLNQTDPITRYLSWIIILTVLLIVALLILRLLVWLTYATFPRLYERIDLLKLDYRYRNKKWELPVIWTAVLCLYNRGIIGIQSPLQNSGERAVDLTFSRIQYDPNLLNSDEQYLIHWLFNKSGGSTFAARSIAGPDLSNASHRSRLFYYRARLDMLYSRLCTWSVLVSKRYRLRSQKRYEIQRKISFMIGIILAMLMPLLLFIDHDPSGSIIFPSLDQIVFIVLLASLFMLIISTASFFLFLGYVGSIRQKTLRSTVIKRIPALIVVVYVALLLLRQDQIGLFDSSTMVIMGVTFIFLISSYVFPIAIIKVPLAGFRHRLSHGAYRKVKHPDRLERLLQASMVLECGNDFLKTHPQLKAFASQYPEYAMLLYAERVIAAKHTVFQSQIEFEKYDTEHPYENYDKQHSGGFKYSSNDSYVSNSYNSYSNSDSDNSCLSDNPGSHHMDLSSHGSDSNDSGNSSDSNSN